jgi:FAD/FMN-containing dehydrogenase/Fe-S oxidoreductase
MTANQDNAADQDLKMLSAQLEGDLYTDLSMRLMYATDASVYREIPMAVIRPKNTEDIKKVINFASANCMTVIPRGAGTSLAGQVVGRGLVVDVSRYMNRILEFNASEKWVRVEPGVVLDELNQFLEPSGLFFAPETSTSNRCMIGGMVGNNSSGSHSLIYGSTRDHLLEARAILADGSEVEFRSLYKEGFERKLMGENLENRLYRQIHDILSDEQLRKQIRTEYPDPSLIRRNTGYAIDTLLDTDPFSMETEPFNFCKLISGSEGTLAFVTEVKLNLVPLPPAERALICVHFDKVANAIKGNLIALDFNPGAVELMDKTILDLTRENITQSRNRFFLKGDPGAILIIEFARAHMDEIKQLHKDLESAMRKEGLGYHFPLVTGQDIQRVWSLRKAGLGVMANIPGDAKPVSVIEDNSVNVNMLEEFIEDFNRILKSYELECVYHAHISVGELHLRPVLNLKDPDDIRKFRDIARDTARLTRKYRGSLSGEHGDGRVRGEFIPIIIGEANYEILKEIKHTWDPDNVFNAGKIIDTAPMDSSLRYLPGKTDQEIPTVFDFSESGGIQRMAEKCNGSGDCRKSALIGGTMCPSFMATRDEQTTTRARANILREFLNNSQKKNPFDHREIYEVLDLCLSCKGCKSECPSNVDMAKMKAEFLQQYYDLHRIPARAWIIANISGIQKLGMAIPRVFNFFATQKILSKLLKKILGFSASRSIPVLSRKTLRKWIRQNLDRLNGEIEQVNGKLCFFVDEFTNYNDTTAGIKAIRLLQRLGYQVVTTHHEVSGRTFLSKGLLRKARNFAESNVRIFSELVSENIPLVGLEPSAILGFRDEYPELVGREMAADARKVSAHALTLEEFLEREIDKGLIPSDRFTKVKRHIKLHGHCQQKSISTTRSTLNVLSLPAGYTVEEIPSGCCGMAGSFGYEKEHYDLSMKVGELVLFPTIRKTVEGVMIAAPGTSCRHQIKDGTGRRAMHPAEILHDALV